MMLLPLFTLPGWAWFLAGWLVVSVLATLGLGRWFKYLR